MVYSDNDLEEIGYNPIRLNAYFWHMEKHWRRLSRKYRTQSQMQARKVVGDTYECGTELVNRATHLERCADFLRDYVNADLFVRSTLEPAHCTCHSMSDNHKIHDDTI